MVRAQGLHFSAIPFVPVMPSNSPVASSCRTLSKTGLSWSHSMIGSWLRRGRNESPWRDGALQPASRVEDNAWYLYKIDFVEVRRLAARDASREDRSSPERLLELAAVPARLREANGESARSSVAGGPADTRGIRRQTPRSGDVMTTLAGVIQTPRHPEKAGGGGRRLARRLISRSTQK